MTDCLAVADNEVLEHFYDRDIEIDFIKEMLGADKADASQSERIINFSGLSGSGKSWLVQWLWSEYRDKTTCYLSSETDAVSLPLISGQEYLVKIVSYFVEQLEYMPDDMKIPLKGTVQEIGEYLDKFLNYLDDQESMNILLLIDNYDIWPSHLREVFENIFLSKIVSYNFALVVMTSRSKLSFQYLPTLSFSTTHQELETFTHQVIKDKYQDYIEITPHIIRVTAGLPVYVESLVGQLHKNNIKTISDFLKHEKTLVINNYEELIKEHILGEIEPDIHDTMCVLCILRRFNIGIMSYILPEIMPYKYQGFTNIDYLELIDDLGYLASWNSARNGYSIQKTVRKIISYYMRIFDFDLFQKINQNMLKMYEKQVVESPHDIKNIIEDLYHKLISIQLEKREESLVKNISSEFSSHVKIYFKQYKEKGMSIDSLIDMKETLEADDDIKNYVSEETRKMMDETIKSFSDQNI